MPNHFCMLKNKGIRLAVSVSNVWTWNIHSLEDMSSILSCTNLSPIIAPRIKAYTAGLPLKHKSTHMVTVCKRYLYIYIYFVYIYIYAFRCRWVQLYHIDTYNSWNVWTHSCGSIPICLSFGRFRSTRVYFIKISNQTLGFASPQITSPDIVDSSTVREKAAYLGQGQGRGLHLGYTLMATRKIRQHTAVAIGW